MTKAECITNKNWGELAIITARDIKNKKSRLKRRAEYEADRYDVVKATKFKWIKGKR